MNRMIMCVLAISLMACEHGVTIDAEVTISVAAQQNLTAENPVRVMIRANIPKTNTIEYSLGVLCNATTDVITVTMQHDGLGCAKAGTVHAWLATTEDESPPPECGVIQERFHGSSIPESAVQTSTPIFANRTDSSGCADGSASVQLNLE